MASEVGIVNAALIKIGEATITSLSDGSKAARLADAVYADLRDAVLAAFPWNFAIARASLPVTTAPTWGYTYAYNLPESPDLCLRVIAIEQDDDAMEAIWKVEGRQIVTDEGAPLKIRYIKQVTDPNQFSALFREALASRIAAELAEPLKQSTPMGEKMMEVYRRKLDEARTSDSQEGTPEVVTADEWLDARN